MPITTRLVSARTAFFESFKLLLARPELLAPIAVSFIKSMAVLVALNASLIPLTLWTRIPAEPSYLLVDIVAALLGWYYFATALSLVIFVSTAHWAGRRVSVSQAKAALKGRFYQAMFGDPVGALQLGLIGFCFIALVLHPGLDKTAVAQAGRGTGLFLFLSIFSSLLEPFVFAYTALSIRNIILRAHSPKRALTAAHHEITSHLSMYALLFTGHLLIDCVCCWASTAYKNQFPKSYESVNPANLIVQAALTLLLCGAIWLLDILAYVWICQQHESTNFQGENNLVTENLIASVPLAKKTRINSFLKLVRLFLIPLAMIASIGGLALQASIRNLVNQQMSSQHPEPILRAMGLQVPDDLAVDESHVLKVGSILTVQYLRLHKITDNVEDFNVLVTLGTTKKQPTAGSDNTLAATRHDVVPNVCLGKSSYNETHVTVVSSSEYVVQANHGPIVVHQCRYTFQSNDPNMSPQERTAAKTRFKIGQREFTLDAKGALPYYDRSVVDNLIMQLSRAPEGSADQS